MILKTVNLVLKQIFPHNQEASSTIHVNMLKFLKKHVT